MAKYAGRDVTLTFSADSVGGIEEASFDWGMAELNTTDHDDADETFISGRGNFTMSLTLKADSGDVGQAALMANINAKTGPEAYTLVLGNGRDITGSAFVTAHGGSGPNDGVAMFSVTLRGTGSTTEAAV